MLKNIYNKRSVKIIIIILLLLAAAEIAMLLVLKSQNNRYRAHWDQQAARPAQANELIYVAVGDSVGVGIGASSAQKGYVGLVAQALSQKTGRPVKVINLSESGARIKGGVEKQLPTLKTLQPDLVTVELGANDVAGNWNPDKFRRDTSQLMDGLPKQTIISDMPYFGGGVKRGVEDHIPAANEIIRQLAAERGLPVAPLHEITKRGDSLLVYAADFFHPSNRGHRNWFQAFWSVIGQRVY